MWANDQETIKIAREYFMRADQGRPDIFELFHDDAEIYFPKFGFGFGRESFLEMVKGFEGSLEYIQHDYDSFTFIPSGDYLIVEGTSHGRMSGKSWAGAKLLADVSATSLNFVMAEYPACTFISIPTIRVRMNRGFAGARIDSGDCRRTYAKDFHIVEVWAVFTVFAYFLMAPARADFFRPNAST